MLPSLFIPPNASMPAHSLDVDREAVRVLALAHGLEVASKQTGINLNTIKRWSADYNWFARKAATIATNTTKPGDAHLELIAQNGNETKLGLSEYAKRQAQHLATKGKLKDHGAFRNLASGSSTLHGWNDNAGQAQFSLNVLNLGGSVQIGVRNDQPDTSEPSA